MASCNVEEVVETYINGNISDAKHSLQRSCTKSQVLGFVKRLVYEKRQVERLDEAEYTVLDAIIETERLLD